MIVTLSRRYLRLHRCEPLSSALNSKIPRSSPVLSHCSAQTRKFCLPAVNRNQLKANMSGDQCEGLPLPDVIEELERLADIRGAESWDNVGLLIEPFTPTTIKTILLTNDLTEPVMTEALNAKANLIVSYHPPLFAAIKRVGSGSWKERLVASCLENRVAVYSPHTAWDAAAGGVNDWLASAFTNYYDPSTVAPIIKSTVPEHDLSSANGHAPSTSNLTPARPSIVGAGRHLTILGQPPLTLAKCVELVKRRTNLVHVRLAMACNRPADSPVTSIALVPGSGGSILKEILKPGSSLPIPDLFVTGEMFHHDLLDATHAGVSVILTNHSDSERGFLKDVAAKLQAAFDGKVHVVLSTVDRDPLRTV